MIGQNGYLASLTQRSAGGGFWLSHPGNLWTGVFFMMKMCRAGLQSQRQHLAARTHFLPLAVCPLKLSMPLNAFFFFSTWCLRANALLCSQLMNVVWTSSLYRNLFFIILLVAWLILLYKTKINTRPLTASFSLVRTATGDIPNGLMDIRLPWHRSV